MGGLRRGDWVEVRSRDEILGTLDSNGRLDGMPFMPEMLAFCGRRLQVESVAHKTCDTVNKTGGRKLEATVHLAGTLCDGAAHGGCQAACLLFWKEAWLRPVRAGAPVQPAAQAAPSSAPLRSEADLALTVTRADSQGSVPVYICQATALPEFTTLLPWWDVRQYVRDVTSGNHSLGTVLKILLLVGFARITELPLGFRLTTALYTKVHRFLTGRPNPFIQGAVPVGQQTPTAGLQLQAGEQVRVKSLPDIARTLDGRNHNRGLSFDVEMSPYSGEVHRVARQVTRIVDERTGKLIAMKTPCIVLDGVVCRAHYSRYRILCPRALPSYWRENWLERVAAGKE
jgi:hypothetical protein